jgi:diguanylate cyclase (GGDEF)-like protein
MERAVEFSKPSLLGTSLPEGRIVRLVERCASVGLALALLLSGGFAVFAARSTSAALHGLHVANSINVAYQDARYAVAMEESLERKYRLQPAPSIRAAHRDAEDALAAAIRRVAVEGDAADRAQDAEVLRYHAKYVSATQAMFAAVDARNSKLVDHLDTDVADPVFGFVQENVFRRAAQQRAITEAILKSVRTLENRVVTISVLLLALSVICFGLNSAVLQVYKRRLLQAHRAEMLQLAEAALVDHLTGVGNHRAYKEAFRRQISRASRSNEMLALALIDIDEMKSINDQHGHMHGDRVLQKFGVLLQALPVESQAFRLGGDEFGVLLPKTSPDDARSVMEQLRKSAERELLGATISVGIATFCGAECDGETLQGQADAALYGAKRAGRNTCVAFDATVAETWLPSPAKVRQLRDLIAADNMEIVFQPIWDVTRCNILAYEALARPAPEFGFSGPQELFDLAERVGRAHEIDAVCRRATLRRAKELPNGVLLFLNMTPDSLEHGRLDPRQFAADVLAAGLSPQRVVIEITERSITQIDVVINVAKGLQDLGFRLALDDTGAGNAGLEMLSQLAVDFIKIDRGIIVKALSDRSARAVMAGIIAIAKETGAYVIAEGIEDMEMLDLVCGQDWAQIHLRGVRGVQGYLLRRPCATMADTETTDDVKSILQEVVLRQRPDLPKDARSADVQRIDWQRG